MMSPEKRTKAANYLAANLAPLQAEMYRNYPPSYSFLLQNLPHDEVLDDEFFAEFPEGERTKVHLLERVDEQGRVLGWTVQ